MLNLLKSDEAGSPNFRCVFGRLKTKSGFESGSMKKRDINKKAPFGAFVTYFFEPKSFF